MKRYCLFLALLLLAVFVTQCTKKTSTGPISTAGPTLAIPANGAVNQATNNLAMSWEAVSGAASYSLEISQSTSFAATTVSQTGISATNGSVSGLTMGGTYYWRVNATGSFGVSNWSSVNSFSTGSILSPTLAAPANGAAGQAINSLALSWAAASGAASYNLQISQSSSFATTTVSQTGISAASTSVSGLTVSNTYYWRVNATGSFGVSDWSGTNSFSTASIDLPEMLSIPTGTFNMGSLDTADFSMAIPIHSVTLSPFTMSKYPITQKTYVAVMDSNPSHWPMTLQHPVEQITWYDAIRFCNKISKLAGLDSVYSYADTANGELNSLNINYAKNGYRMPTEAEYEYAQRAGTTTDFYWGKNYPPVTLADTLALNSHAIWFLTDSTSTAEVGTKPANPWGLYDMCGNVFTWCNDRFNGSYDGVAGGLDPTGATDGEQRICRGGSWGYFNCGDVVTYPLAAPYRWEMWPYLNGWMVGLRVVRGH